MRTKWVLIALAVSGLGYGVWRDVSNRTLAQNPASPAPVPTADPEPSPATSESGVTLTPEQVGSIVTEKVSPRRQEVHLETMGKVGFNEDQTSLVLAPIAGQVSGLRVRVGDRVSKGDVIFVLRSREVTSVKSEYLESQKDVALARQTNEMTQKLFDHQAASTIQLQQAQNDLAKAETRLARTAEQLRVLGVDANGVTKASAADSTIQVKAAIDGTIVERHVTEGQFVQGDSTPLLTVADLSTLWVLADVFERDLSHVKIGQTAAVTTLAYPDNRFSARVSHVSDVVDATTRTVKLRLLVDNVDGRLKPEMFASVNLLIDDSRLGLSIPARAVLTDDGRKVVYVKVAPGRFSDRVIEVAAQDDGHVGVVQGLAAGDEVVTDGALLLRHEQSQARSDEDPSS